MAGFVVDGVVEVAVVVAVEVNSVVVAAFADAAAVEDSKVAERSDMEDKLEQDDSQAGRACVVEHRRGVSACRWMVLAEEVAAVTERHTVEAA